MWSWYTGRWWVGCYIWYSEITGGTAARPGPSSLYQMQQPTHQRPVYRSPYCCGPLFNGFNVFVKGLTEVDTSFQTAWAATPKDSIIVIVVIVGKLQERPAK